jgi:hypothetical protein
MIIFLCILGSYLSLVFIILFAKIVPCFVRIDFLKNEICTDNEGHSLFVSVKNFVGFPIEYCGCEFSTNNLEDPYKNDTNSIIIPSKQKKKIGLLKLDVNDSFVKSFNRGRGCVFLRFRVSSIISLIVTKKIENIEMIGFFTYLSNNDIIKITDNNKKKQKAIDLLISDPKYKVLRFFGYRFERKKNKSAN